MDGVGGQVELASLPGGGAEYGSASGAQAGLIVGDNEFNAAHAALDEAVEEGPPVDLGFRQRDADAEHPAPLVGADADCREDGCVANNAAYAHLLIPGGK